MPADHLRVRPVTGARLARAVLCTLMVAVVTFLPGATAGTAKAPELVDAAGDVAVSPLTQPLPSTKDSASDLLAAWITQDSSGLRVNLQVASLAALMGDADPQSDAILFMSWRADYANGTAAAQRDGEWRVRADVRQGQVTASLERPCKDGKDSDGCAGGDRDIVDGLVVTPDAAASTVSIAVPWAELGDARVGDRLVTLQASTQYVYPAYPVYLVDWDTDQPEATYVIAPPVADKSAPVVLADPVQVAPGLPVLPLFLGFLAVAAARLRRSAS